MRGSHKAHLPKTISRTKFLIFSVVPVIFLLIASELTLRVWAYYFRTSYERYNYSTGRLELVPNTHLTTTEGREILINLKGFVGPEFEENKSQGLYRIFALGDSCTFGGSWRQSYPALLEKQLNSAGLKQRFEVINAGIEGYNSEYALGRLKQDLLQYAPDMVTIYIGWNDLMKLNPNNLSATGKYTWLARLMGESYLIKGYSKLFFYYLRPLVRKPQLDGDESDVHSFDHFVPSAFQENLEAIFETLQSKNIRPVLVTLPTVLTQAMTYDQLRRQNVFFPYFDEAYSVPRLLSLHRAYNDAIRKTALKYKVPLVDLDAIFNEYDKNDLFWDTMHPSDKGHRLISEALFQRIEPLFH